MFVLYNENSSKTTGGKTGDNSWSMECVVGSNYWDETTRFCEFKKTGLSPFFEIRLISCRRIG